MVGRKAPRAFVVASTWAVCLTPLWVAIWSNPATFLLANRHRRLRPDGARAWTTSKRMSLMDFEIMKAACRPGPGNTMLSPASQRTFSVAIRPVVAKGRKAAAWVRIVGAVRDEASIDRAAQAIRDILIAGSLALPRAAPRLRYRITAAGKRGGLRRPT